LAEIGSKMAEILREKANFGTGENISPHNTLAATISNDISIEKFPTKESHRALER
jgi:hypothetical protein